MRRPIVLLIAAAVAVGLGLAAWRGLVQPIVEARSAPASAPAGHEIGGPFALVDQDGRAVTDKDLLGKPSVLFFGYTYCPDVCPTTLASMTQWMKALGPDADRLNVRFITIDPERDTPKQLKAYLTAFDPRIRGLTGSPAQVAQAAKDYNVYYAKADAGGGTYSMDHSTTVYLMDAQGRFVEPIGYGEEPAMALASLKKLLHP
jgi:protein SCO1/2